MHIRLKDYGRNQKKRKEYIHQSGFLLAGVDVGKTKRDDCIELGVFRAWVGVLRKSFKIR